ncbi:GNAT family N-acetyltransferase [Jeotgalibacillus proteolyticus]|uniref:GNAT family N-acetyltransferase n=1 Tax=Jeotgalibacillus proteolyticus TaxID=2082395 RepID=A0A2S5GD12_9BACL|nr:GNAT family N-acetyltransferase [Jeotgalibacillus proteolyticus]PPA70927.1 GNAT family N-acetyltransferase [Jeotgalibacillus proteolyticus]
MLTLQRYKELSVFKNEVVSFLENHEVENNLCLGILESLTPGVDEPILMAAVKKHGRLAVVLLQTIPEQVILSKSEGLDDRDYTKIAQLMDGLDIPGFVGEKNLSMSIMKYIGNKQGKDYRVQMNQRIYKLDKVKKDPGTDGSLRVLTSEDLNIVEEWVYNFHIDCNMPIKKETVKEKTLMILEKGRFHGWESGGKLVSVANIARPTKTNCTVTLVYTPKELRGNGYASSCVSALTKKMLNEGFQTASLYTDLDNPTSNKIYMEIGYEPIMDSIAVHFK